MEKNIRLGTLLNVGPTIESLADSRLKRRTETPRAAIDRVQADLTDFARRNKLEQVIVVNVSSTEPPVDERALPRKWADLDKLLNQPQQCPLAPARCMRLPPSNWDIPLSTLPPHSVQSPRRFAN